MGSSSIEAPSLNTSPNREGVDLLSRHSSIASGSRMSSPGTSSRPLKLRHGDNSSTQRPLIPLKMHSGRGIAGTTVRRRQRALTGIANKPNLTAARIALSWRIRSPETQNPPMKAGRCPGKPGKIVIWTISILSENRNPRKSNFGLQRSFA
jgi:hypothetical protein